MGDKYSLIKQLEELEKNPVKPSPLPKRANYSQHTVIVENEDVEVFIPVRESDAFIEAVSKQGKYLKRDTFKELMRKHRGVRNWE